MISLWYFLGEPNKRITLGDGGEAYFAFTHLRHSTQYTITSVKLKRHDHEQIVMSLTESAECAASAPALLIFPRLNQWLKCALGAVR